MVAPKVVLEILSPLPLASREDGQIILEQWKADLPDLLPNLIGNWEPIDRRFDANNFNAALNIWKWPFLAVRDRPRVNCSIWMRKASHQQLHSTLVWDMEQHAASQDSLLTFLKSTSAAVKADFALLHLLTDAEIEYGRHNRTITALDKKATQFNFFLASKDLKRRIPGLFWATAFGAPYVEMFGRDRLVSAPAYQVQVISNEVILLQMTKDLADVDRRSDVFNETRSQVKQHLTEDAFFRAENEVIDHYRVPKFAFV